MCKPERSLPQISSRRRKWCLLLLVLLALLGCGYLELVHLASRDLEAARAELDQLDPGWRLEDLDAARGAVPAEQNSIAQARLVLSLLSNGKKSVKRPLNLSKGIAPEIQLNESDSKALEAELAKAGKALTEARKLRDLPRGQPDLKHDASGLPEEDPPPMHLLSVARLLDCDVVLEAQANRPDAALDSCRAILNVGRSLGDDPSLMALLVRQATRSIAVSKTERTLAQTEPSAAALGKLQTLMELEDGASLLRPVLRRERAHMDRWFDAVQAGKITMPPPTNKWDWASLQIKYMPEARVHAQASTLRFMTELVETANLPEHQQWLQFRALQQSTAQHPERAFVVVIPSYFVENAAEQARLRCARAALAVERYLRQQGDWPKAWADLVKDGLLTKEPLDPFDGQPLRLRRLADGFVVYSIGPDGRDDGGKINSLNPRTGADLGFRLWNVMKRRQAPPPPSHNAKASDQRGQ